MKSLGIADTIADRFHLLDRQFDTDALIRLACRRIGSRNFGDTSFIGAMTRLLDSIASESALSVVGRAATRWDVLRFLSNLLSIQAAFDRDAGLDKTVIKRPIFITGLPRSGTTFLHRLMLTDGRNRAPMVWETIYPSDVAGSREHRIEQVQRQLRAFERLAPEFRSLHPLEATSPQECSEITAHVFRSLRFDTTYNVPTYRNWMDSDVTRHVPAYRFHKRFLQYLQGAEPLERRWVLKCPEHIFAINAIRTIYPDARLVFVHRDPVKVLLSQAQLTEVLRRPFTRHLDPQTLGPLESRRWLDGARRMMAVGDDAGLAEPVCHVHHLDLISDPVATVDAVYRHFGMDMSAQTVSAIQRYVRDKPNGGYGEHAYRFEDHGLNESEEREKFRPYMVRFGIHPETMKQHQATAPIGHVAAGGEQAVRT